MRKSRASSEAKGHTTLLANTCPLTALNKSPIKKRKARSEAKEQTDLNGRNKKAVQCQIIFPTTWKQMNNTECSTQTPGLEKAQERHVRDGAAGLSGYAKVNTLVDLSETKITFVCH